MVLNFPRILARLVFSSHLKVSWVWDYLALLRVLVRVFVVLVLGWALVLLAWLWVYWLAWGLVEMALGLVCWLALVWDLVVVRVLMVLVCLGWLVLMGRWFL